MNIKEEARDRRHKRLRKRVTGTTVRPRLSVFRSLNHIYAQIIDDTKGVTLVSASTIAKDIEAGKGNKSNIAMAQQVGKSLAEKAQKAGINQIVFDRGGYKYHGCIKALADAARESGLAF